MHKWCKMMVHEGGGIVGHFFIHEMLDQWGHLPVVVEDYPYTAMDYQGDPDMPRPPGQAWNPMVHVHDVLCVFIHI